MIVIADTTPLNYLILIGHIDVLEVQYGAGGPHLNPRHKIGCPISRF